MEKGMVWMEAGKGHKAGGPVKSNRWYGVWRLRAESMRGQTSKEAESSESERSESKI